MESKNCDVRTATDGNDAARRRRPFGFLLCGMVIGFSIGLMVAKRLHAVEWMIIGLIVGTVFGAVMEGFNVRKG